MKHAYVEESSSSKVANCVRLPAAEPWEDPVSGALAPPSAVLAAPPFSRPSVTCGVRTTLLAMLSTDVRRAGLTSAAGGMYVAELDIKPALSEPMLLRVERTDMRPSSGTMGGVALGATITVRECMVYMPDKRGELAPNTPERVVDSGSMPGVGGSAVLRVLSLPLRTRCRVGTVAGLPALSTLARR